MTIFKASLDPKYWSEFVRQLSRNCDGNPVSLLACTPGSSLAPVVLVEGIEESYAQSYVETYSHLNCWAPLFSKRQPGEVFKLANVMALRDLQRTAFYNDWLKPQENLGGGAGVLLAANGETVFCLGATVRLDHVDRNEEFAAQWIRRLLPYILQAQNVSQRLDGLRLDSFAARESLNAGGAAIFVISNRRVLLQANDAGYTLLQQIDGPVHLLSGDRLGLREMSLQDHLETAITSERRGPDRLTAPFPLRGPNNSFYSASAIPLDGTSAAEVAPNWFGYHPSPAVLLIVERVANSSDLARHLAERFGLTKSEVDIADRLSAGGTIEQIADARQVSIHTIRHQMKSAMAKTGTRRQTDLAMIVTRMRRAGR